jgi:alkylation response protein AidB-like acyl-CoA dehydrogenase
MSDRFKLTDPAALEAVVRTDIAIGRRECRLPSAVRDEIVAHDLFRLWIPARYGGLELPLPEALRIYEAAARLDGSFGWSVMIGAGGGLFAAYLSPAFAEATFRPRTAVVAGSGAIGGTAEQVPGGFRVTGRWRYASGADYATVFTANCRLTEHGMPLSAAGDPLIRAMAFSPKDVTIHRTWDTTGLRATGSHDMEVRDVFVPVDATFVTDMPLEPGPLYRIPFGILTELPVSAVVLGIAQHAVDEFASLARSKPAPGSALVLEQLGVVCDGLHDARAQLEEARRELYELASRVWAAAQSERRLTQEIASDCTETSVRLVRSLVSAVTDLVPLSGMNALRIDDPFSIAWRDLEAAAAHYSVSPLNAPSRRASAGK